MIYKVLDALDRRIVFERAKAHCDIPCGIYDPMTALIAALTVVRMDDLMAELHNSGNPQDLAYQNSMSRYISVKEDHAEMVKKEVRVIWGDYMKQQHIDKHPGVNEKVHRIMQLASQARQTADRSVSVQLVEAVNEFAEIYWDTKGVPSKRAKAPYAPGLEIVYPNV